MRNIFILFTLLFQLLCASSLSPAEITEMISKIKEERVGISIEKLESTVSPFIIVQPKKEENLTKEKKVVAIKEVYVEPSYSLDAILNHKAFINNKWYKKGSKLDQYKIIYIGKKTVTLKSSEKKRVLSLKKKKYIKLH
ncbi:hypothetical protein MNB_SV-14-1202 [hydrothermal vent metagenome]|uniref:Transformation system protein n=1 Tax=hydrothermal vent metagenome TaxID=652676 RepID=A0A1W1CPX5_9ZZZZ